MSSASAVKMDAAAAALRAASAACLALSPAAWTCVITSFTRASASDSEIPLRAATNWAR